MISKAAFGASSVYAADLDGDGDVDVLSASSFHPYRMIAWYENSDGIRKFDTHQIISRDVPGASSVFAADLDEDGDLDVLSASQNDDKIAWYENRGGTGDFGSQNVITTNALNARSVYASDIDGDGDLDVLSASSLDAKVAWYENTDGRGTFGTQQVISRVARGATSVYAADLDGDGDVDVLSASSNDGKIAWYENLSPHHTAGDANHDGVFNQLDIVQVLQANRYLSQEAATFEEGDWNNDGLFDQLDIVTALQEGAYLP